MLGDTLLPADATCPGTGIIPLDMPKFNLSFPVITSNTVKIVYFVYHLIDVDVS